MLKYLVIQLDDTSVSYCYYQNCKSEKKLIPFTVLNEAINFALKHNLLVQIVYPTYTIPQNYQILIDSIYHSSIVPIGCEDKKRLRDSEIIAIDRCSEIEGINVQMFIEKAFVLKASFKELRQYKSSICKMLTYAQRINIIIKDAEKISDENIDEYQYFLSCLSEALYKEYAKGHMVETNLLTDRIILNHMNNCNAGTQSVALAPDGMLYACPAFYLSETPFSLAIGNLMHGIDNVDYSNLCKLDNAPICRICDAWQCKRCIWLNSKATLELNIPGKEQCLISHIERNESKKLLNKLKSLEGLSIDADIPSIDYLDPLEKITRKK